MPLWAQHAVVIALALACAGVFLIRRLRALAGRAPACDACANGAACGSEPREPARGRERPIPAGELVRRARRAGADPRP